MSLESVLTIFAVALVTFALRAAGVLAGSRALKDPGIRKYLEIMPVAVLAAILTPMIASLEGAETGVAVVVTAIAFVTRNLMLTMLVGTLVIGLMRNWPVV